MNIRAGQRASIMTLALVAAVVAAEDREEAACLDIASPTERLACYDALHGFGRDAEVEASASGAVAPDAGVAEEAQTDPAEFGFAKTKPETEGESLSSPIAGISKDGYKRLIFELENGQVWRQIEYKRLQVDEGDTAVIRHGSFGSYKLYVGDTKRWTRVRRVQ